MSTKKSNTKKILVLILSGFLSFSVLGLALAFFTKNLGIIPPLRSDTSISINPTKPIVLEAKSLTIGMLWKEESYTELANYLREKFGSQVQIVIDGSSDLPYQEAKNRIAAKEWDIAFTLSPMISVAAKDNNYSWVAKMFPEFPAYYQSSLFVRNDSPIQSIANLANTTVIALGDFNSASSFYMPIYDLFGKSISVKIGYRGQEIRRMVMEGEADIGAAAYSDIVKNDPDIRVIHISRNIPGSGVYLSPNLSISDREKITQVLLNAPPEIQKKANYGAGEEPDYSYFIGVSRRAEEVLSCADFTNNPVNFFCRDNNEITTTPSSPTKTIFGIVNGITQVDNNTLRVSLAGEDQNIYHIFMSRQLLNQIPGAGNSLNLQNKQIRLNQVIPEQQADGIFQITLSQSNQLIVSNDNLLPQTNSTKCNQGLSLDASNLSEIRRYQGCLAEVVGRVQRTFTPPNGKVTFLNLGSSDYKQAFTVVIFESSLSNFEKVGVIPEKYYNNQNISVFGEVTEYQGKLQIIVDSPSQIQIK